MEIMNPPSCLCCLRRLKDPDLDGSSKTNHTFYVQMIFDCFSVRVTYSDASETSLCKGCVGRLEDSYAFKRLIQESQATLLEAGSENPKIVIKDEHSDQFSDGTDDNGGSDDSWTPENHKSSSNSERDSCKTRGRRKKPRANDDGDFACTMCKKSFASQKLLDGHVASHFDCETCPVCEKRIAKVKFRNHMDWHVNKYVLRCPVKECGERFKNTTQRHVHMNEAHAIHVYKYDCAQCPKKFFARHMLTRHVKRSHARTKNAVCDLCGYRCRDNSMLKNHMLKHSGRREQVCTVCSKAFARTSTLQEHMKIHNSFKALKCDVCDQGFTHRCTLRGHLSKIHGISLTDAKADKKINCKT